MPSKTTRDVDFNGKHYPADKPITFGADDEAARDQLLALDPPAIVETKAAAKGEVTA